MFTGIVEEVGSVKAIEEGGLIIGASEVLSDVKVGDSIAVNGAMPDGNHLRRVRLQRGCGS